MKNPGQRIEDDILVLRCQQGDAAAFESLVTAWQERLWKHACRLTGDEDAAYDILQEAWLAISGRIDRLHDPAAFPAWAYRIVTNKSNDWIRRACRRRKGQESFSEAWASGSVGQPEEPDERVGSLKQALARLSSPDLALLNLKYEEGFDSLRIAEALGVPEGTVRSRLHYIRTRLRNMMEGTGS